MVHEDRRVAYRFPSEDSGRCWFPRADIENWGSVPDLEAVREAMDIGALLDLVRNC